MEKIFDPYFTTKSGGNGLGLTICHSIVKKHGGHISVRSKQGDGTTFVFYLPASFEKVQSDEPKKQAVPGSGRGRLLVVDDEADLRIILVTLLEHFGYEVAAVPDGTEAVSVYSDAMSRSCPFDLVITDLTIPGSIGGGEIAQKILQIDPKARIVVSSGYCQDPLMARPGQYGFIGVIEKPYDFDTLGETIAGFMSTG
jgi:CheY-like chemotaxis protein